MAENVNTVQHLCVDDMERLSELYYLFEQWAVTHKDRYAVLAMCAGGSGKVASAQQDVNSEGTIYWDNVTEGIEKLKVVLGNS